MLGQWTSDWHSTSIVLNCHIKWLAGNLNICPSLILSLKFKIYYVTTYQCKVDGDMLNAVKSVLADVSSVSPSSEQRVDKLSPNPYPLFALTKG